MLHIMSCIPVHWPCWSRPCFDIRVLQASNYQVEPRSRCSISWWQWACERWTKISYGSYHRCMPSTSCFWGVTYFCSCSYKLWVTSKEGPVLFLPSEQIMCCNCLHSFLLIITLFHLSLLFYGICWIFQLQCRGRVVFFCSKIPN